MIGDIRQFALWGQSIPSAAPQWILALAQAPSLLSPGDKTRWSTLLPRLNNALNALGYVKMVDVQTQWSIKAWEANLALCMLNFPSYNDEEMLRCAIGIEFFEPDNEKELQDNKLHADQLQQAIDRNTAFGNLPPGV